MISISSPSRKQYAFTVENGTTSTALLSIDRVTVSIKPYGTNEAIVIQEVTNTDGSIGSFPNAE